MISKNDLKSLELMPIGTAERLKEIFYLYDKEGRKSKGIGLAHIFNYGYMIGKRDERKRKKRI